MTTISKQLKLVQRKPGCIKLPNIFYNIIFLSCGQLGLLFCIGGLVLTAQSNGHFNEKVAVFFLLRSNKDFILWGLPYFTSILILSTEWCYLWYTVCLHEYITINRYFHFLWKLCQSFLITSYTDFKQSTKQLLKMGSSYSFMTLHQCLSLCLIIYHRQANRSSFAKGILIVPY